MGVTEKVYRYVIKSNFGFSGPVARFGRLDGEQNEEAKGLAVCGSIQMRLI